MSEQDPMISDILALPDENHKGSEKVQRDVQRFKDRVAEEIKKVHWVASMPKLLDTVTTMLHIPLPRVMVRAWEKGDEIKQAIEDSSKAPDDEFSVELAEHTIEAEFKPEIEVHVGQLPPVVLPFVIKLSLELKGMVLLIKKGRILQISTGSCQAGGELLLNDLLLAERKLEPFTLPGTLLPEEAAS